MCHKCTSDAATLAWGMHTVYLRLVCLFHLACSQHVAHILQVHEWLRHQLFLFVAADVGQHTIVDGVFLREGHRRIRLALALARFAASRAPRTTRLLPCLLHRQLGGG